MAESQLDDDRHARVIAMTELGRRLGQIKLVLLLVLVLAIIGAGVKVALAWMDRQADEAPDDVAPRTVLRELTPASSIAGSLTTTVPLSDAARAAKAGLIVRKQTERHVRRGFGVPVLQSEGLGPFDPVAATIVTDTEAVERFKRLAFEGSRDLAAGAQSADTAGVDRALTTLRQALVMLGVPQALRAPTQETYRRGLRATFERRMRRARTLHTQADYAGARDAFTTVLILADLEASFAEAAQREATRNATFLEIASAATPFRVRFRFVRYSTKFNYHFRGYIDRGADPSAERVFLYNFDGTGRWFRTVGLTVSDLSATAVAKRLARWFQQRRAALERQKQAKAVTPLEYLDLAQFLLECERLRVRDPSGREYDLPVRQIAHGYLSTASDLDPNLDQTVRLRLDPEFSQMLQAYLAGEARGPSSAFARHVENLKRRYPDAWYFSHPGGVEGSLGGWVKGQLKSSGGGTGPKPPAADDPRSSELNTLKKELANAGAGAWVTEGDAHLARADKLVDAGLPSSAASDDDAKKALAEARNEYQLAISCYEQAKDKGGNETLIDQKIVKCRRGFFLAGKIMPG